MDGSKTKVTDEWETTNDGLAHQTGEYWVGYTWFADEGADTNDPPWICYPSSSLPHVSRPKGWRYDIVARSKGLMYFVTTPMPPRQDAFGRGFKGGVVEPGPGRPQGDTYALIRASWQ